MELSAVSAAVHAVLASVGGHRGHEGFAPQYPWLVTDLHAATPDAIKHHSLLPVVPH